MSGTCLLFKEFFNIKFLVLRIALFNLHRHLNHFFMQGHRPLTVLASQTGECVPESHSVRLRLISDCLS